jgi:hypothetical protein
LRAGILRRIADTSRIEEIESRGPRMRPVRHI